MPFAHPAWLLLLLPILLWGVVWGAVLVRNYRRRQRSYLDTGHTSPAFNPSAYRAKLAGHALLVFALCLLVVALGRPQGEPRPAAGARRGVNLAILVDGSKSMLCEDVLPSRLQVGRLAVEALASEAAGSRLALFMFGGAPTMLIPGTFDTSAVVLAARSISPDFVGKSGTALTPALKRALTYLEKAGKQPKTIVIVSDGEEGDGDPILTAATAYATQQVRIHTIAIGTAQGGPMPTYERNQKGELVRVGDRQTRAKQTLITHANPELMSRIAAEGHGRFLHLTGGDISAQVSAFVQQAILPNAVPIDDALTTQPREWSWLCVALALAALTAEQWLRHFLARRFALHPVLAPRGPVWQEASTEQMREAVRL
jgi:Ca-activated chloride channel family protein